MLQNARSPNSKSFLREIEFALIIIPDEIIRNYFLKKLSEVFQKRNDPNQIFTGEKALKKEILTYLNQEGIVKTANVWCRSIDINLSSIHKLNEILTTRLLKSNVNGVLEIHLQDREINSPHIQFVGVNAEIAEKIIAQTLVEFGFESNIESAIGKKDDFTPYFEINKNARTNNLKNMIEYIEKKKKQFDTYVDEFDKEHKKAQELLLHIKKEVQNIKTTITNSDDTFYKNLSKRRNILRRIRKRISRRKR